MIRNPNAVEKCMECNALFGTVFTQERCIYDNGKFVICKDCESKILGSNKPNFCSHCRIKLDQGKIGVSNQLKGIWYCDVCLQEAKERMMVEGEPFKEVSQRYKKIRNERDTGKNYTESLKKRREYIHNKYRMYEVDMKRKGK